MREPSSSSASPASLAPRRLLTLALVLVLVAQLLAPIAGFSSVALADDATPAAATTTDATTASTDTPTPEPTLAPTDTPTQDPTATDTPTQAPAATDTPAPQPTATDAPIQPTATDAPAAQPTNPPTKTITGTPTITSDKADYHPGGLVVLTGTNWQPGETVHIYVNDDAGQTWNRNVDVTADSNGNITDTFNLPNWFVANYSVIATGSISGVVKTSFTDGNLTLHLTSVDGVSNMTVTYTLWSSSADCTGSSTTGNQLSFASTGQQNLIAGSKISAIITSVTTTTPGKVFDRWAIGSDAGSSLTTGQCLSSDGTTGNFADLYARFKNGNVNTTTTVTSSQNPSTYGQSVMFTANVTASSGPNPSGAGTVTFTDGATTLCANVALSSNTATCTTSSLSAAASPHSIAATYSGATGFNGGSGNVGQTVNPKALTISGATANNKTYDGTTAATVNFNNAALVGVVSGDTVTFTTTGYSASFANKTVANGKTVTVSGLSLGGASAGNYSLTQPTLTANITVRALTVSATGVNKVYDGTNTATVTLSDNRISGDVFTDSYTSASFADKNIGTGKAVSVSGISISGADASNYTVNTTAATSANITALAVTGSFTAQNKTYDGNASATVLTRTLSGAISGDAVNLSGGTASFSDKNVGTAKTVTLTGATLSGADAGNYSLTSVSTTTANITAATVTGSFTASDKVYDGSAVATILARSIASGVVGAEDVTLTGGSASFADKNVGTGKTVTGTGFALGGVDAANYVLGTVATTTASITAKSVTVSGITANSKTYDATTAATLNTGSATLNGVVSGDTVNLVTNFAAGAFGNKNVGTGKTVTISGLTLSGSDAGNYALTQPSATADITALAITGHFTADSKVYDGTAAATIATRSLSGVLGTDDVSLTGGTASFGDKNAGAAKTVTGTGFGLSGMDAANYSLNPTTLTTTADITQRPLTVTATADNKVYDGTTDATVTLGDDRISGDDVTATYTSASFGDANVGTGKTVTVSGIAISGTDAANYAVNATATTTADITIASQSIMFDQPDSPAVYNTIFHVAPTSTSNLPVAVNAGGACSVAPALGGGFDVTMTSGTGACVLTASQDGNNNYAPAESVIRMVAATKAAATIELSDLNPTYDGTPKGATVTTAPAGLTVIVSYSQNSQPVASPTKAGSYNISATISSDNYVGSTTGTLVINPKSLTGHFAADNKVYDGGVAATVTTGSRTLTGVVAGDDVSLDGGTATFADKVVATGKTVTLTGASLVGADAGNYTLGSVATTTADITALTITGSFTAQSKVYDGTTDATITGRSLSGAISGDAVSLSGGTASFSDKNVGVGKTVTLSGAGLSGTDAGNYSLTSVSTTTANITKRDLTVSAAGVDKVYDGTTNATVTLSDNRVTGDVVSDGYVSASFADKNVETNKVVSVSGVSISGTDAGNYTLTSTTASTTANITARTLHVTATGQNKVYDGTTDATVTLANDRVTGDTLVVGYINATFLDKNVGMGKTVNVAGIAIIGGGDASNYTLDNTDATTTADITPLGITGGFTASDKVYDGNTSATVIDRSLDGVLGVDAVSLTGGTATFADKVVATGKTVTLTGASLVGADAGNYSLDSVATTRANITALGITGSFTASDKVYDGTTAADVTGRSLSGTVSGDDIALDGGTASFADKNVGASKTVILTGASLNGADAGNYSLTSVATTTADISARALLATAHGVNKVYDGTTAATVTFTDNRVGGDGLTVNYTSASFGDKNVGVGKLVSVGGISLTGADAANYTVNTIASTTADITRRGLIVSATGVNKVYDGNANATVTLSDNRVSGDALTANCTSASFADANVGTGKTVTVSGIAISGTDAANYSFNTTATTTADITPLTINGSFTTSNKVYDGTTAATVGTRSLNGVLGTDDVSLTGGAASFSDKNVGTGKTVTLTGASLTGAQAANYTLGSVATAKADITALAITGSFTAQDKTYDGSALATVLTRSLAGWISGDAVSLTGGTASFADKNVGTGKTVTLTGATLSGLEAGNYSLTGVATATASITPKTITGSFMAADKIYDGTTAATITGRTLAGVVPGDVVSLTGGTATFDTKDPGIGKTVTGTGFTLTGADAGNYVLASTTLTTTASITYGFAFLQPINYTAHQTSVTPGTSVFKAGSTIPVKFSLYDAFGNVLPCQGAAQWLGYVKVSTNSSGVNETTSTDTPMTSGVFTCSSGVYQYNWSTKNVGTGYYYKISVLLPDGEQPYVYIGLK